ncbi:MAG TPA: hypothetical protein VFC19_43355 [Candidatus Limnocylindrales bacterium]|nr:hypothetical protein [Candidatus Limnocylindrales bacterium]
MNPTPPTSLTIITKRPPTGVFINPTAVINGQTVPLRWGENVVPAPPGVHHITIYMQWLWKQGTAQITVDNSQAPAPPVYYAMPYNAFQAGAIGFQPQNNPGLVPFLLIIGVPLLLLLVCCIGGSLMGR